MAFYNGFVRTEIRVADGDQITVGAKGVLTAGIAMNGNATALIRGIVTGQDYRGAVTLEYGRDWNIDVESTAVVTSSSHALSLDGNAGSLINAGRILAGDVGVLIHGRNNEFHNSGTVEGQNGANFFSTGTLVNEAGGTISGEKFGVYSSGSISNFGTISGSVAVKMEGDGAELVNNGEIFGNIQVSGRDTLLDMRGGQLNGIIRHEGGTTVVLVDDSDLRFVSTGWDTTVKASVDYALGSGVEKLVLTGTADLTGKGNSSDNRLVGNDGNNVLQGMQGRDFLIGGKGDDTLTGGAGRDTFIFASGDGNDVITDFRATGAEDQRDFIELRDLVTSWQDRDQFFQDHVRNDQGNVIVEFEDLSITLLGVRKSELSFEHFQF